MAITVNEKNVAAEPCGGNAARQRLLTQARVILDRVTLSAQATLELEIAQDSLGWLQLLDGTALLSHAQSRDALTANHIVFLPPGFRATLTSSAGATLLHARVPGAQAHDPAFAANPPRFRIVDWTREPVLDSEHDARKRIYVATPKLFDTKALKGEIIIYPPGTEGANHHHEGAEHFMYVTRGRGVAYANESPVPVTKGDLIYYGDRERHYLRSEGSEDMVFVEFFVPGVYKTVWAPGAPVCTWTPTGKSISGEKPAREIAYHRSDAATPQDV